jgi:diguanylate cyclase (GGDEF)-like protein/PAS domain S-box-containing protein
MSHLNNVNIKDDQIIQSHNKILTSLRLASTLQHHWRIPVYISLGLLVCSIFNHTLFHTLIELFAIGIAIMSFVVAWNTFSFSRNRLLLYLGCGYFWIGVIDLFHTLSFEGIEIFDSLEPVATIEFWIIGRYLEALILLIAPLTLIYKIKPKLIFFGIGLITAIAILLIFTLNFPVMYIEGRGLTQAKILSEYIIIALLVLAGFHLRLERYKIESSTKNLLLISIALTIIAELCFTVYIGFSAPALLIGHIFKFFSFWAIYQALIESALTRPIESLSRVVKSYDSVSDPTLLIDEHGTIQQANKIVRQMFSESVVGKHCHNLLHPKSISQAECTICQAIEKKQPLQDYEFYNKTNRKWYEATLSAIHLSENSSTMVHAFREITKRKIAEEQFTSLNRAYQVLSHTNQAITRIKDKNVLFQKICEIAINQGGLKMAWIGSLNNQLIKPEFFAGSETGYLQKTQMRIDDSEWSKGPVGIAAKSENVSCVNDINSDPDFWPWRKEALERGYASLAAVPLFFDGKVIAIFTLYSSYKGVFDTEMTKLLSSLSDDISAAVYNMHQAKLKAQAEETIEQLAFYDPLTKLANRRLLMDRLDQAIISAQRHKEQVAVLLFDLDNFKTVNDSLGHDYGDQLLQHISTILKSYVRAEDTVARLGGDEFTVVVSGIKGESCVIDIANKILSQLEVPVFLSGNQLVVSSSIGISLYPQDGAKPEALLRNADLAMYHAKDAGKNRFQFFQQEMNIKAKGRLELENDLRKAVKDESFELLYQPQVDMRDDTILGFEALIRWRGPKGELISPDVFIPLAEETGLIEAIGDWVIKQAFKDWQTLYESGFKNARMAVNVAAYQFQHANNLCSVIQSMIETYPNCSAERFTVELTEGTLIENIDETIESLNTLKSLGISISIDDFGTGYSSLSYLKRFPIDQLKIDKSFVQDLSMNSSDDAIVTAIIAIAQKLGMKIIAEGVETTNQSEFLKENMCPLAQGYLYYKPLSLTQLKCL